MSTSDVIAQTIQMVQTGQTGQTLQPIAFEAAAAVGFVSLQLFCGCFLPLLFLVVALIAGSFVERAHLKRLVEAETAHADIVRTDTRAIPAQLADAHAANRLESELVLSSVVLSIDHFRNFVTALRKLIGGELGLYGRLAMRARREAMVRLLAEAKARGAVAVINVRFETSNINGVMQAKKNKGTMVEVLAYGTALRVRPSMAAVGSGSHRPAAVPPPPPPSPARA